MNPRFSLTGNQLKLIALIAMTCDHVGLQLLPQFPILRIIGRIAFPIFAWMIAEGCQYTHNRKKYLLAMWGLAATCQLVYLFAMGSLYMSVLVSFGLAIGLIYLADGAREGKPKGFLRLFLALTAIFFLCRVLPGLIPHTDYAIDYGLWGVLLPLFVYEGKTKGQKLAFAALALTLIALEYGGIQWFSLLSLPLLALYSGKRGKRKLKYLFYIYYPAHLVAIYGLSLL